MKVVLCSRMSQPQQTYSCVIVYKLLSDLVVPFSAPWSNIEGKTVAQLWKSLLLNMCIGYFFACCVLLVTFLQREKA